MKLASIFIVYRKEMLDTLRDRRTLMAMIVVPLLLIPVLIFGLATATTRLLQRAQQEVARVMILGAEHAPALAARLQQEKGLEIVAAAADYADQISNKQLRAALELPAGFEQALARGERPTVKIYHYAGEIKSQFAVRHLEAALTAYRDVVVTQRLAARHLSPELLTPFETRQQNVAPPEKVGGSVLGGFLPYLIIVLMLQGAMYPAIDLAAGEKERGTIETILASPVGRSELVLGKFLTVLTASIATAALSLASLAASFTLLPAQAAPGRQLPVEITLSGTGVAAMLLMVLPLAVMFAAALLAIAILARSFKEAQSYISPLMIVVILPAVASVLPGLELDWRLALVPILSTSLVSKEIIIGHYPWHLILLIFASSCVYALAALFIAVRAFQRETVLFRT